MESTNKLRGLKTLIRSLPVMGKGSEFIAHVPIKLILRFLLFIFGIIPKKKIVNIYILFQI